jgi:hypothetical protein
MHRNIQRLLAIVLIVLGSLTVGVAPASAQEEFVTFHVTVDQATVDPRTGLVTLSGTITCSVEAEINVVGELHRDIGPDDVFGYSSGLNFVYCPGPGGTTFTLTVAAEQGRFVPGPATLVVYVDAFPLDPNIGYSFDRIDVALRLVPAP